MQFFAQTAMAIKGIKFICKIAIFLACLIWVIAIHCNYLAKYHSVNPGLLILHVIQLGILFYILRYGFEKFAKVLFVLVVIGLICWAVIKCFNLGV
jgi:hypothetical protein